MNLFKSYDDAIIEDKLEASLNIYKEAVRLYKPKATIVMFSGGDDSLTTLYAAKELGIPFDYIIHGNTGTGIKETHDFVLEVVSNFPNVKFIETHPKKEESYEVYVRERGFYGNGKKAHQMSYSNLKGKPFRRAISKHIRKRRHNYNILLLNGARRNESEQRKINCVSPYNEFDKPNIWVNLINDWDREDCLSFLEERKIKRNPVSIKLGRSGECNCGTTAKRKELHEMRDNGFHSVPDMIELLENEVAPVFPWGWSYKCPRNNARKNLEDAGQLSAFMPMCSGCSIRSCSI